MLDRLHERARVYIDLHGRDFPRPDLRGEHHCEGFVGESRHIRTWAARNGLPPTEDSYFGIALNLKPQSHPVSVSTLPGITRNLNKLLV